jgi:putative ABC transport system permease protein
VNVLASARIAVRALRVNKLRSALTMLGIVIGVGAQASLSEDDALAIERDIPLVAVVAPAVRGGAQVVYSNLNWATTILGVTPEYLPARDWEVSAGRSLTREEVDGASKVAMIGQTVARNLFGDDDPLGQVIRIKKVPFTVIGIMDRKGQTTWGQDQDDQILIPLSTAKTKVVGGNQAKGRAVGTISIKVRDAALMKEAENEVRELLRQRHRLQPYHEDDFNLRNLAEVLQSQEASSRVLTILLAAIASVSLLVGGIGIMNIMLVSVTERTREIGLRMAVGARGKDNLAQFLVEAVTLSLIGGVIGVGAGLLGSHAIAYFAEWRTLLQFDSILLAFGFSAAVGIFFGFYPARKAAGLNPIAALRYE